MSSSHPSEPGGDETLAGTHGSGGELTTLGGSGGMARDDIAPPAAGQRVGAFVVQRVLGSGAMGVVLLAHDPELDRPVAIKLLAPRLGHDALAQQRLLREAQSIARLSHPNVVAVHQAGMHGDQVYVVMEYVDGGTLRQWAAAAPRSWREIVDVYGQAAHGLAAAHAAGLVHRDFKPDNVLIGRDGRVRVSDFGLVAASGSAPGPSGTIVSGSDVRLTSSGAIMGTPAYMAPEQFAGERVDARADQFAFCVALFEALHGARPFGGEHAAAIYAAIVEGTMRPPTRLDLPASIHGAIVRGLALDPQARHPSMSALLAAIAAGLPAGAPVRSRGGVGVALAIGVGALTLAGGGAWFWLGSPAPSSSSPSSELEPPPTCAAGDGTLGGAWTRREHAQLDAAFVASGNPNASDRAGRTRIAIDRTIAALDRSRVALCEAAQADALGEDVVAARTRCLDAIATDLVTTIDLLRTSATARLVDFGAPIVQWLPSVAACDDDAFVAATDRLRRAGADAPAVARAYRRAFALFVAEEHDAATAELSDLTPDDPALAAIVQVLRGLLLWSEGAHAQAVPVLEAARAQAQAADDPYAELDAIRSLILAGKDANALAKAAQDAETRAHAEHEAWRRHGTLAYAHGLGGDVPAAIVDLERAIVSMQSQPIVPGTEIGALHVVRGHLLTGSGRVVDGEQAYLRGLALLAEHVGVTHKSRTMGLNALAKLRIQQGRTAEALLDLQELQLLYTASDDTGIDYAQTLELSGDLHVSFSAWSEALVEYERAFDIFASRAGFEQRAAVLPRKIGAAYYFAGNAREAKRWLQRGFDLASRDANLVIEAQLNASLYLGLIASDAGEHDAARGHFETVRDAREQVLGRDRAEVVDAHLLVAEVDIDRGDCVQAGASIDAAATIHARLGAPPDANLLRILLGRANCATMSGDLDAARREIDNADALTQRTDLGEGAVAWLSIARARLAAAEGDAAGARTLAQGARVTLQAMGMAAARDVRRTDDLLARLAP